MIFINLALIGISTVGTATSYEISIFNSYPIYIWISFFVSMALAIYITLESTEKIWRVFGVSILFFINFIFLLLPFFRNYALYGRADVITHLEYISNIIASNHISMVDFYPFSHIFVTNFYYLSNINVDTIMMIVPAIFFVFYYLGLYLFTREITTNSSEILIVMLLGTVLLFSYYDTMFLPTQLSFSVIPMILFFLFRSKRLGKNNFSYGILFIIFLLLMPFFHPLTSINLIFFFILIGFSLLLTSRNARSFNYKSLVNPLFLLIVSFLAWISSKTIFNSNVARIYNWFVNEVGTPTIDTYKYSLSSSNLSIFEVVKKILLTYGTELIYILIAILSILYLLRRTLKNRNLNFNTAFLILGFITFTMLSGLFLMGAYGISNPLREFVYVLFFATILNGIYLARIGFKEGKVKRNFKYFFLAILLVSSGLGLYSSYASISTGETNIQVTNAEFTGMGWFYSNRNPNLKIYDLDKSSYRFSDYYNGVDYTKIKMWMFKSAPYDFNFTSERGYLIINNYVFDRYTEFWPDNPYFQKNDFNNLNNNLIVNKVYDNGDDKLWTINNV